jgi:glutathione transport system ATP-binding protein
VRDLVARFPLRSGILNRVTREVHAVEKVSFDLWPETLFGRRVRLREVNDRPGAAPAGGDAGRHHRL